MKICSVEDCYYPVFSKKLCNVHWKQKYGSPVSKSSAKRQKQIAQYVTRRKAYIARQRVPSTGRLFCKFCGKQIHGEPELHHTMGRDDETLLDEQFWHLGHHECHQDYHNKSCKDIPCVLWEESQCRRYS